MSSDSCLFELQLQLWNTRNALEVLWISWNYIEVIFTFFYSLEEQTKLRTASIFLLDIVYNWSPQVMKATRNISREIPFNRVTLLLHCSKTAAILGHTVVSASCIFFCILVSFISCSRGDKMSFDTTGCSCLSFCFVLFCFVLFCFVLVSVVHLDDDLLFCFLL